MSETPDIDTIVLDALKHWAPSAGRLRSGKVPGESITPEVLVYDLPHGSLDLIEVIIHVEQRLSVALPSDLFAIGPRDKDVGYVIARVRGIVQDKIGHAEGQ